MSIWKRLFGGGDGAAAGGTRAGSGPSEQYKGYTIRPTLMSAGSEYQLSGTIEKEVDGELRRHDFVRADKFSSKDEAESFALAKGRQIIDEQGDAVFNQNWPASRPN